MANEYQPNKQVPPDLDNDRYVSIGVERLGLHYELNAILNRDYKTTPLGDAFQNLHLNHAMMYATGKTGMDSPEHLSN